MPQLERRRATHSSGARPRQIPFRMKHGPRGGLALTLVNPNARCALFLSQQFCPSLAAPQLTLPYPIVVLMLIGVSMRSEIDPPRTRFANML